MSIHQLLTMEVRYNYPSITLIVTKQLLDSKEHATACRMKPLIQQIVRQIPSLPSSIHDKLCQAIDLYRQGASQQSYCFLISKDELLVYTLPFLAHDKAYIDHHFCTQKVIRELFASNLYTVLAIGQKNNRRLAFQQDKLLSDTQEKTDKSIANMRLHQSTNNTITEKTDLLIPLNSRPFPMILAGSTANIEYFHTQFSRPPLIIGEMLGDFSTDRMPKTKNIGKVAYDLYKRHYFKLETTIKQNLKQQSAKGKVVCDIAKLYLLSQKQQIKTLYVQKDFFLPAAIENQQLILADQCELETKNGYLLDCINLILWNVLQNKGEVILVTNNQLKAYNHIVAIQY